MLSAGEFRKGATFEMEGKIFVIVDFQHVKPGKGAAFVRTKIKNIMTGQVLEKTFNPTEKFEIAKVENKEMQYLYNDGELYYFMDTESFDQVPFNRAQVEDLLPYLIDNMNVSVQYYKGEAFSVVPPNFVELTVAETDPGFQGDTSKPGDKAAKLETGVTIRVPLFINTGDKVKVDTRSGTYVERM